MGLVLLAIRMNGRKQEMGIEEEKERER